MMYNSTSYGNTSQDFRGQELHTAHQQSTNRYIYVQKGFHETANYCVNGSQKVLINPHFGKSKVFVNPNFSGHPATLSGPAIHVNPRMATGLITHTNHTLNICPVNTKNKTENMLLQNTTIHINPNVRNLQMPIVAQTVHINPKFTAARTTNKMLKVVETSNEIKENIPDKKLNQLVVLTKTKLIRSMHDSNKGKKLKKRRNSVKSKYKIVKSGLSPKKKTTNLINICKSTITKNRFKIDNRKTKYLSTVTTHPKKYVYINKLVSSSDLIKTRVFKGHSPSSSVKSLSMVNINGIVYRKSRNSLRRASVAHEKSVFQRCPTSNTRIAVSIKPKTKVVSKMVGVETNILKNFRTIRKHTSKKKSVPRVSPKKLRKCNIPCPYYRKYGICKGNENGKCFWKHDPDQIALCTRFLQGACIKENCLLSHNVSPEKMPTCKYYLEGSCSRENCPYLHVKISPKAEVCRDFLEGFCKKAVECDKRHQYLCPDYEKYGKCVKQRCPYPHGKMVRSYLINKNKFAKKCSDTEIVNKKRAVNLPCKKVKSKDNNIEQTKEKKRYYAESKPKSDSEDVKDILADMNAEQSENNQLSDEEKIVGFLSRPKLGSLPSFIPFGES